MLCAHWDLTIMSMMQCNIHLCELFVFPVDNCGTVVGENPTPYGILALWAVNGLSIVYWVIIMSMFTYDLPE